MKGRLFDRIKKTNFSLKFDSISVKIYETVEEKIDVQIFEYNLPFFFLPLFYFKGEEKFKIFLSKIIIWDNMNKKFKTCEIPERDFIDILKIVLILIRMKKSKKKKRRKKEEKKNKKRRKKEEKRRKARRASTKADKIKIQFENGKKII